MDILDKSHIFVLPSLAEEQPLVLLEAMEFGLPVVASNVFSLPEVVGKAGILVNPYNLYEISTAIYDVLTNNILRIKLITEGFKHVKKFSWKSAAERTLDVYSEILFKWRRGDTFCMSQGSLF